MTPTTKIDWGNLLRNFWKLILTVGGTATGATVAIVAKTVFNIDLDPVLATAIAGLLSALLVGFGPANKRLSVRVPELQRYGDNKLR